MSDQLKKFVNEHRQEFDTNEPGKDLWDKIDAQMELKNPSRISSRWLSTFKYLGFGASVLVVAVYFITRHLSPASANLLAANKKDSAVRPPQQAPKAGQNQPALTASENTTTKEPTDLSVSGNKNKSQHPLPASPDNKEPRTRSGPNHLLNEKKDAALTASAFETKETGETKAASANEKKENDRVRNSKKTGLYIPAEPENVNSYTGTLYESASVCQVLRAYKFPGKVSMKDGLRRKDLDNYKRLLKTISCSRLESMTNIKAVWLKGKTDKELTLPIKKGFKNIVLVKRDGRKLNPEAISHYYPGRGVISEYAGKYLNMVFKNKVGLILFFKDAEEGDRIVIDGALEAVVEGQP